MTARTETYELKAGTVRRIKVIDNQAPVRFELVSGQFTIQPVIAGVAIGAATSLTVAGPTVLTAPGGAWGSEIKITCDADGVLHTTAMG